jgi:hypothetical protein
MSGLYKAQGSTSNLLQEGFTQFYVRNFICMFIDLHIYIYTPQRLIYLQTHSYIPRFIIRIAD